MIRTSRNPCVVRRATWPPFRSITTFEPSVVPCTAWASSAHPSPARATSSCRPATHARGGGARALAGEEAPVLGLEGEIGEGAADVEPDPERHAVDILGAWKNRVN